MKKIITVLLPALCMVAISFAQINTPAPSPHATVTQTVGLTDITLDYSRPAMKGRTIFAEDGLVPLGQVWRTGANQATTIEFTKDVVFGGKEVKAGKYALYTQPGAESWDVMLYSDLALGGNTGSYDKSKEVARTSATPVEIPMAIESFTMGIGDITEEGCHLDILWDHTYVPVEIKVHTHDQVMAQIDQFAENPMGQVAGNYLNSGWYLYTAGEKEKGLEMLSKGIEHSTSPFNYFWMARKAQVQADLGDYAGAIKTAEKAHKAGMEAPDNAKGFYDNTVKAQLDDNIKMWSSKS